MFKENDLFLAYDNALSKIASLVQQVSSDPSIRPHVLSLDFSYSSTIKVVYEEFTKAFDSEEGEAANGDSLRDRIQQLCTPQPMNLALDDCFAGRTFTLHPLPRVFYLMVNEDDGLTFTPLPSYQSLVISDFVEVGVAKDSDCSICWSCLNPPGSMPASSSYS